MHPLRRHPRRGRPPSLLDLPVRKIDGNGKVAAPHYAAIVASPKNRGRLQDDTCMLKSRQQLYFGKVVMKLRSLRHKREQVKQDAESIRNTLPNIPALKRNADHTQKWAHELTQQAEAARQGADIACRNLARAQDQAEKVDRAEGELQWIDQELKVARSELRID